MTDGVWTGLGAMVCLAAVPAAVVWWVLLGKRRYRTARTVVCTVGGLSCMAILLAFRGAADWGEAAPVTAAVALLVLLMLAVGWVILRVQRNHHSIPAGLGAVAALGALIACFATSPRTELSAKPTPAPVREAKAETAGAQATTPSAQPAPSAPASVPDTHSSPSAPTETAKPSSGPPYGAQPVGVGRAAAPTATGECAYEMWGPESYGMGDWAMPSGEVLEHKYGNKWYLRFPVGTPVGVMERVVDKEFRRHRKDKVVFPNGRTFRPTEMTLFVYHTLDPFTKAPKVPGADGADRSYVWKKGQDLKREFP